MLKCSLIFFILFLGNMIICYIFSTIGKKIALKRQNKTTTNIPSKKTLWSRIKSYLSGWIDLNIRLTGFIPSFRVRKFIYQNVFLMKIGKRTKIRAFSTFYSPWNIEIGENTMVGQNCIIDGRSGVKIGNNVNISDFTSIFTAQHITHSPYFETKNGSVNIEDRVWLSFRSTILPNISLGGGGVLAAGAILTKDLEEFSVYTGIPAVKKSDRNKNLTYELDIDGMHFI